MMKTMKSGKKSDWLFILSILVLLESCCLASLVWHQSPLEEEIEIIGF